MEGPANYLVWLNDDERIASFNPVNCYRQLSFHNHSYFLDFLLALQQEGFRFQ